MLPIESLRSMKVMFATPCYVMGTTSPYTVSMFSLGGDCVRAGLAADLKTYSESAITRSRNRMVATFLADPSYTHLFWWDADVMASSAMAFRLLLADHDVAVGIYPLKQFNWPAEGVPQGLTQDEFETRFASYPFFPIDDRADDDGFCEVYAATTGFMCIKRAVFDKMKKAFPSYQYTPDGPMGRADPIAPHTWRFFDNMIDPGTGRYLTEDYAFCHLWRACGGQILADANSRLMHLGTHLFKGDLMESLRHRNGVVQAIAAE